MKLKKIASLALAGIMAVSMLAGCKNGESSSSSSSSEATVTTSDSAAFAEALNDERSDKGKNVLGLDYKASSSLENTMKAILNDEYGKDSASLEDLIDSNSYGAVNFDDTADLVNDLSDKVTGGIDTWSQTLTTAVGTYKYARVYAVGGSYTPDEAAHLIAANTAGSLEAGWLPLTNSAAGVNYIADYTAEVAAVKMTSNANPDVSVWFVTVLYTQVVTADN